MPEGSSSLRALRAEADRPVLTVAAEALAGLRRRRKTLPAKLFYDEAGCALFARITELPEYYVTRTELALLRDRAPVIAAGTPEGTVVVEYGAGDETKATLLLEALRAPSAYVPIDIAASALAATAALIRCRFPRLDVHPIATDFLADVAPPAAVRGAPILGFFPGSTIGNLEPDAVRQFFRRAHATLGRGARFLVGVDLRKDASVLIPAYDDSAGVTAAFNRNLLVRLNREAGADFDPDSFTHRAVWNERESRIEMHLVSRRAQTVQVADETIRFEEGETIHTENSYKHTVEGFRRLAARAGWSPVQLWTDPDALFSMHLLQSGG